MWGSNQNQPTFPFNPFEAILARRHLRFSKAISSLRTSSDCATRSRTGSETSLFDGLSCSQVGVLNCCRDGRFLPGAKTPKNGKNPIPLAPGINVGAALDVAEPRLGVARFAQRRQKLARDCFERRCDFFADRASSVCIDRTDVCDRIHRQIDRRDFTCLWAEKLSSMM